MVELISTPKIITFLSVLSLGCEKNQIQDHVQNIYTYHTYLLLFILTYLSLFILTAPNKQFSSVG